MAVFAFLLVTTGINLRGQLCEPLVSISTTTSNICQGSTAVFNATALNAGSTPSYQWKVNGINTGTNSNIFVSSTLNNNDIVVVELTPDPSTCPEGPVVTSAAITVTVNLLPAVIITPSDPTTFCQGGSVTLASSAGTSYLWSTGEAIQSITITATGSYSVTVTDANGCSATSAPTVVTVNPLPIATITPAGPTTFCQGGSVILTSSPANSYLWNSGETTQSITVAATGSYSVTVTDVNGCSAASTSTDVTVNTLPIATITPAGPTTFCQGGSVTLTSSAGISYLWSTGETSQSITVTVTGSYSVSVTDVNGCSAASAPTPVTMHLLPAVYSVTGGGAYCNGGPGLLIGLSNSEPGVNYQLYRDATTAGSALAGTGAALSFGNQTAAGAYTVVAANATTSCTQNMTGSATVTINPLPTAFNVTGGGGYCSGGTGVSVGLSGSQNGVSYQLQIGGVNTGSAVSGTGAALSFGLRTAAGTYTVVATNPTTSCTQNMSGSATVTINPLPTAFNVTGGGAYCSGGAGAAIGLNGSQSGVNYQLRIGGVNTGGPVAGTGSSISFGNQTAAGTYTVIATNTTTSCNQNMTGSASVIVNPLPTVAPISGPTSVCVGSTINLTNTTGGGTWSISNTAVAVISSTGVVSGISGGSVIIYYSVTNGNGCTRTVNSTVAVNSTTVTITPAGPTTFCRGSSVTLTASGANTYTWSPGDGLSITTGPTVIATPEVTTSYVVTGTGANGCTGNAQVTVTVNQRPEGIMSSDPAVCSGSNSGTVNLTIADGSTVIGWESSTNAGTTWSPYTPLIDQYTTSYLNLTQTTVYRALLQLNGCQAYSSIGIIPVNNVLEPVVTVSSSVSCLNTAITLHASGYGQPPFPVEDFQRANPVGWSGDDAGSNNEDPNSNWALTTNGKTFNGINYNSQATPTNSKFIIVTGVTDEADHNATITAPPFSLVGTINPILSYYTALNFNAGSTGTVEISTDGGTTFTDLITYTGPRNYGNPDGGWINVTYSLVPYINQPDVRIRFNYTGTAGSNWGLDNIGIISTFQPIVYHWTPLDHMTPPTGDTPDVTVLPDVGLHTYCVSSTTAAGCESDTVCITVNVLPLPDCSITGTDGPVCPSSVNSFTAPAGMSRYAWTISGNGRVTAGANAQNVTVTSGTGCNLPFTISLTITDNNGCVSTCSKTVLVQDITPPIISCPVISAQYRMDNGLGYYTAVGTEFDATATDNCIITSITHNLAYSTSTTLAGYHFPLGSTTVTWTATDACGLTATCQIIVTVIDDQPPAITCPPPIIVQCAADVPVPYVNYSAFLAAGGIATDNNQINPALFSVVGTDIITNQSCANRYTITRTYQVNDLSGNSASCTQAITVNDQTAPVITGCPANQIFCETPTNVFTIPASISAGDNCGGAVDITYEITGATTRTGSGNNATGNFNIGGSTITWTATDVCGNVATCSTTVTINPRPVTSPIYHR